MYPIINIRQNRVATVKFQHPWIFSGALILRKTRIEHGSLVYLSDGKSIIATGTYSAVSSIAVRIFDFKQTIIDTSWFVKQITEAYEKRLLLNYGPHTNTTAYRVVFGESDNIPGLVVDRYGDVFVIQLSTAGIENLRKAIIEALIKIFNPQTIIERSDIAVRQEEQLPEHIAIHYGKKVSLVEFQENGLRFTADLIAGQKTGFFLDQKELRKEIMNCAEQKHILNLFSYSGATGIAAIKGGAKSVHNVDCSEKALTWCGKNRALNSIDLKSFTTECADAFEFLSRKGNKRYNMILIDPPALIKSKSNREEGIKAYHFLNRAALKLINDGGIFVSSSCSHFFPEEDFAFMLRQVSVQSKTHLSILKIVRQSPDHPLSVYFPQSAYLKTFICHVRKE